MVIASAVFKKRFMVSLSKVVTWFALAGECIKCSRYAKALGTLEPFLKAFVEHAFLR